MLMPFIMLNVVILSVVNLNVMAQINMLVLLNLVNYLPYFIECSMHFSNKNDAEIFSVHYTQKVAEKGYNLLAFMMNKHAMINSCEIILEK